MKAGDLREHPHRCGRTKPWGCPRSPGGGGGRCHTSGFPAPCGSAAPGWPLGRDFPCEMFSKLPAPSREPLIFLLTLSSSPLPDSWGTDGVRAVSPQVWVLCTETMTTDEATKSEGEVQAAALAERGEDITPARDRGVLKVSGGLPGGSCLAFCTMGCMVTSGGCIPSLWGQVVLPGL